MSMGFLRDQVGVILWLQEYQELAMRSSTANVLRLIEVESSADDICGSAAADCSVFISEAYP